jgi:cation diffusion facilitator CzcD-associated flavoprotein CzcO
MNGTSQDRDISIAIIGAGFAGLGMAIQLKKHGIHSFTIYEGADEVGGTWRDNTYPGCACDVPSHLYSFSFERNPSWSNNYSPQPEILDYLKHCTDKYGVRPHIRFKTWITDVRWDDDAKVWWLESSAGERFRAKVLIAGTGPLRTPSIPEVPGLDTFPGEVMHSARWNHAYDFAGKRVASVGTGASAIQFVPELAKLAERLHVYQRTPAWVMPRLDGAFPEEWKDRFRKYPALTFGFRNLIYWVAEGLGTGFFVDTRVNRWRENMAKKHMEKSIADPELRKKLTPDYVMGCKRVLFSNDYYPALARENVEVITSGVTRVEGSTVVASDGSRREVDAIVFGTGFAVTDFLSPLQVRGRGGRDLNDAWKNGAEAYYGMAVSGFPNAFILVGPNTGLGHNSIVFMIEAQVHYVLQCIQRMKKRGLASIEVRPAAQRQFNERIQERLQDVVWNTGGCVSWYLDENGKNVTLWPGYTTEYWLRTRMPVWSAFLEEPLAARRAVRAPRLEAVPAE